MNVIGTCYAVVVGSVGCKNKRSLSHSLVIVWFVRSTEYSAVLFEVLRSIPYIDKAIPTHALSPQDKWMLATVLRSKYDTSSTSHRGISRTG